MDTLRSFEMFNDDNDPVLSYHKKQLRIEKVANDSSIQGPRIDFQSEGAKIVLYLVSPGSPSMVGAGWENFWFLAL